MVIESEDILAAIVISYLIIIVSVFLILFYFNKARNKKLWMPFFKNLEAMKSFSLASNKPIPLVDSEILEFSELNTEIGILTDKVRGDYKNLKQFTEDVSHELQNPLAIIQAKIENIINGDTLNDNQFEHLTSIQKDIQRLAQMNKRLTILTKIENNQFAKLEKVTITDLIQETITNFLEISSSEIEFSKDQIIEVQMDRYLAEILCNNLMSNAIKHSPKEGKIVVVAKGNSLFVSNEGSTALENPEKLYSRFYRESDTNKSTGLGLAIVKRICDLYRFSIAYNFDENKHIFTINFN
ncbi:sensor histidine kinase [Zobellia laminariae]|uniref:sensor histidine kinase n=1 Tax=Zobellia laminariae TaxID=248906 RepID=UPI0026F44DD2|nr:HAMP domain-containing sensor histidine kinase [Zobellia laminariae]WKX76908.1 HAMP domain-containing sensor histidine kinase [Zobellia laminariae]